MRPDILHPLFSPVNRIKGVGSQAGVALKRLLRHEHEGLPYIRDMLFHFPIDVIDRRNSFPLRNAPDGIIATFIIRVDAHYPPPGGFRSRKIPYKVVCSNETGDITLVFFHASRDYMTQALPVGQERVISGKLESFNYTLQMTHPDIIAPVSKLKEIQTLEPVYGQTEGLSSKKISHFIAQARERIPQLPEWLPKTLIAEKKWLSWHQSMHKVHSPETLEDLEIASLARSRLACDEILARQLHLLVLRKRAHSKPTTKVECSGILFAQLQSLLPYTLTNNQQHTITAITKNMASGERMTRMVQGDVGSGKTVVALAAMVHVAEAGMQSALMAPTELVASQHYQTFKYYLDKLGIRSALLTGSIKGSERNAILAGLENGDIAMVVGTHALFQDAVSYKRLVLAVIDEQHRFGTAQRMALSRKGMYPHLLHMSATPIPRSLMMTMYGDMDISIIKEKPAGRRPIITRIISTERHEEIMEGIARALSREEKIYWVCPAIESDTSVDIAQESLATVRERYAELQARFGECVGMVHGRIDIGEREHTMQKFKEGTHRILIATTVIEVGVDVPDATIMIIEHAERFGLSQLHQLRGRVGRGEKSSSCVLLYDSKADDTAHKRLSIIRDSEDGFAIAEADLQFRGGGDILGLRQSGIPSYQLAQPLAQPDLFSEASALARQLFQQEEAWQNNSPLHILLSLFGYEEDITCHQQKVLQPLA